MYKSDKQQHCFNINRYFSRRPRRTALSPIEQLYFETLSIGIRKRTTEFQQSPYQCEEKIFFFLFFLERVESVIRIVPAFVYTNVRMYVRITFVKQMMKAKGDCRLSPEFF